MLSLLFIYFYIFGFNNFWGFNYWSSKNIWWGGPNFVKVFLIFVLLEALLFISSWNVYYANDFIRKIILKISDYFIVFSFIFFIIYSSTLHCLLIFWVF